jgi:hypothetical protein
MKKATSLAELEKGLQAFGFKTVEVDPRGYARRDPIPVVSDTVEGEGHDGDRG